MQIKTTRERMVWLYRCLYWSLPADNIIKQGTNRLIDKLELLGYRTTDDDRIITLNTPEEVVMEFDDSDKIAAQFALALASIPKSPNQYSIGIVRNKLAPLAKDLGFTLQ